MVAFIADDSPLIRERLAKLITTRELGVSLLEAGDVEETIEAINREQPEILILDLKMPGGSGFDVLVHIREQGLPTRVIVLTNHASEHNRQKSLQLGAEAFFDKSTEFTQALDFLESLVSGADPMKPRAHRLPQILTLGENTTTYQVFSDTESSPYMSKLSRRFDDEDEGGCIRLSGEKP